MRILETPEARRNGQDIKCPDCRVPLKVGLEGSGEIDFCPQCHGMWVDNKEEHFVLDIKPQAFTVDELRRLRRLYQPLGNIEPMRYRPCSVCGELMYRKNWGGHSGVLVNRCAQHGTWYANKGQLEKIKEYIASGGIEYEKLQLMEQGVMVVNDRLSLEISRVKKKQGHARFLNFLGLLK